MSTHPSTLQVVQASFALFQLGSFFLLHGWDDGIWFLSTVAAYRGHALLPSYKKQALSGRSPCVMPERFRWTSWTWEVFTGLRFNDLRRDFIKSRRRRKGWGWICDIERMWRMYEELMICQQFYRPFRMQVFVLTPCSKPSSSSVHFSCSKSRLSVVLLASSSRDRFLLVSMAPSSTAGISGVIIKGPCAFCQHLVVRVLVELIKLACSIEIGVPGSGVWTSSDMLHIWLAELSWRCRLVTDDIHWLNGRERKGR